MECAKVLATVSASNRSSCSALRRPWSDSRASSLAAAPAWAGADRPEPDTSWPMVGLVLPDRWDNVVYAYFSSRPEALPDSLEIAMVESGTKGRVVSTRHCCLLRRPNETVSFHDLDGYAHDPVSYTHLTLPTIA